MITDENVATLLRVFREVRNRTHNFISLQMPSSFTTDDLQLIYDQDPSLKFVHVYGDTAIFRRDSE